MKTIIENELLVNQLVREVDWRQQWGHWLAIFGLLRHILLWFRLPLGFYLRKGNRVLGHAHNFGHPTVIYSGAMRIDTLKVLEFDGYGRPLRCDIVSSATVKATDRENWFYIRAGVWHQLTAEEDGTRYGCWYPFRAPSALTLHAPGADEPEPVVRIDEHGRRWVRLDESIEAVTKDMQPWPEAFG